MTSTSPSNAQTFCSCSPPEKRRARSAFGGIARSTAPSSSLALALSDGALLRCSGGLRLRRARFSGRAWLPRLHAAVHRLLGAGAAFHCQRHRLRARRARRRLAEFLLYDPPSLVLWAFTLADACRLGPGDVLWLALPVRRHAGVLRRSGPRVAARRDGSPSDGTRGLKNLKYVALAAVWSPPLSCFAPPRRLPRSSRSRPRSRSLSCAVCLSSSMRADW